MGEIIVKVPGEGREVFEINLPFELVKDRIISLKKEEKKFK